MVAFQASYLPFLPRRQAVPLRQCRQRPIGVNFDANVKTNHYENCGRSTTAAYEGLSPLYSTYFGGADAIARRLISHLGGLQGEPGDGEQGGSNCEHTFLCYAPSQLFALPP